MALLLLPHSCHHHPSSLLVWTAGSKLPKRCPFIMFNSTANADELRDWRKCSLHGHNSKPEKPGTTARSPRRRKGSSPIFSHSSGVVASCSSSGILVAAAAASSSSSSTSLSRIVTFVGKGGVGKTFSAVLAAQYYASLGLRTALAVQSLDTTADFLLGSKLGTYAAPLIQGNLTAFRVEATKLLREPWSQLKEADARLNFSQGALNEVVSEELGILPGMDSILAIGLLDRLSGITGDLLNSKSKKSFNRYDVVVYDGPSSEEALRIFGAAERARSYLKRLRSLADKTDAGRVALPSILRTVGTSILNEPSERSTAEIWASIETLLSKIIGAFADPRRFGCYIVTRPGERFAHETAIRYWGCAVQAGVHVSGVLPLRPSATERSEQQSSGWPNLDDYAPLPLAEIPHFPFSATPDWTKLLSELQPEAGQVLMGQYDKATSPVVPPSVAIDKSARTVTLFLPGFAKTEVKVSQWRGNTELLVEVGDQRRSVLLPLGMKGKVVGARFRDRSLIVTIGQS